MRRKASFINNRYSLFLLLCAGLSVTTYAVALNFFGLVQDLHDPQAEHAEQVHLYDLVAAGRAAEAFEEAFELGDELFETRFNAVDGVGANIGDGQRFSRIPRVDLDGPLEWFNHHPVRVTGPNAGACNDCHAEPFDDGAGGSHANVVRDPTRSGQVRRFITRNTPHLFGSGAVQRLAEEMTVELQGIRDAAGDLACRRRFPVSANLASKEVDFGRVTAFPFRAGRNCQARFITRNVRGVDQDLVVRPFQWKGSVTFLRDFNRGAAHDELGMQAVEMVGEGVDSDHDGVVNEFGIGDLTALSVYIAAQPRPTTLIELAELGVIEPLTDAHRRSIEHGQQAFVRAGCEGCHRSSLTIDLPVFSEPSQHPAYRDAVFPAGQDPTVELVDPLVPVSFDLTRDQPDNHIELPDGSVFRLGTFLTDNQGRAVVSLFSDLKRHDMGSVLAERVDEEGTGSAVWMTKELWGAGSTAPYLHDGRASTLTEAILFHGGEAARSRQRFEALPRSQQKDLIAFLENLVLFKIEEE